MTADKSKLAKRYAAALFESVPAGQRGAVAAALETLGRHLGRGTPASTALGDPRLTPARRAAVGRDVAEVVMPGDARFASFVELLVVNRRDVMTHRVAAAFGRMVDRSEGRARVVVTSAFPVSDDERRSLEAAVKAKRGPAASVTWKIDPTIVGGLVLTEGDRVVDGSLRGGLRQAAGALLRSEARGR